MKIFRKTAHFQEVGQHLIAEAWGCSHALLNSPEELEKAVRKAVSAGKATLINITTHAFAPHGVTSCAVLSESHFSVHTWPEYGYAAIDVFFCGEHTSPHKALDTFLSLIHAKNYRIKELKRGFPIEKKAFEKRKLEEITVSF